MATRIFPSSGNVFLDAGFPRPEAARLLVRSRLMILATEHIRKRRMTQARAAKLMGVTQPRVSDLMRGRIELFSVDTLIDMLARLGVSVSIVTKPRRRGPRVA
ncbi:MAG: XRE family transcriptional regulator [Gemmatimonadetes bacterium]|nr:XRE family transcriptional regulator [Gemmatimonadota bacterium]